MNTAVSLSSIPYSKPVVTKSLPGGVQTALSETALSALEAKRLEKACAEFESLFINLVMKQMRKSVMKSGLIDGGLGEEFFTGMLDEEIFQAGGKPTGSRSEGCAHSPADGGKKKTRSSQKCCSPKLQHTESC